MRKHLQYIEYKTSADFELSARKQEILPTVNCMTKYATLSY